MSTGLLAADTSFAGMGLTTSSNIVEYENGVPVKQAVSIGSFSVQNTGDTQIKVRLEVLTPDAGDVPVGTIPLSNTSWLQFAKNDFYLNPGEKSSVNLTVNAQYGGGRYKAYVWVHTINPGSTQVGNIMPVSFSVQSSLLKMGQNNIFFPPAKIGLTGNKLVIKLEIMSNSDAAAALYYRKKGATAYSKIDMVVKAVSDGLFAAKVDIPSYLIVPPGLEYYVEIRSGNTTSCIPDSAPAVPYSIEVNNKTLGKILKKGGKLSVPDANPDDGETSLEVPINSLSQDCDMEITQLDPEAVPPAVTGPVLSTAPVMAFEFGPGGLSFRRPVKLKMLYFDLDDDGKIDGTQYNEKDLKIFWWDGYEWRLVGGSVDTVNKIVHAYINHFSMYAIFPAGALTADDFRPKERIITPAYKDGVNDFAAFGNLSGADFEINIYDVTGRLVKKITDSSASGPNWDGTDENGKTVESGIYIYQFSANVNGAVKLISGTIAIAK